MCAAAFRSFDSPGRRGAQDAGNASLLGESAGAPLGETGIPLGAAASSPPMRGRPPGTERRTEAASTPGWSRAVHRRSWYSAFQIRPGLTPATPRTLPTPSRRRTSAASSRHAHRSGGVRGPGSHGVFL